MIGGDGHGLETPVAKKVLSQTISGSSIERNQSTYYIHKTNRSGHARKGVVSGHRNITPMVRQGGLEPGKREIELGRRER